MGKLLGDIRDLLKGAMGMEHTGSSKVSQKARSITVTTRPGCSGVPR